MVFSTPQRRVFLLLYLWRDAVARAWRLARRVRRRSDESPQAVLSDRAVSSLARSLPTSMAAMAGVFNSVPAVVKEHGEEVLALVREGKALEKEDEEEMTRAVLRAMHRTVEEKEVMEEVTEAVTETRNVRGDLDAMVEKGAQELMEAEKAMEKKEKAKEAKEVTCRLVLKRVGAKGVARAATKQKEVEAELNLDELLHDLAMINGIMDADEEESSDEEPVKKEEPAKEEEIKSIRQTYRAKEESPAVKRSAVDDLLGAREVDMSSAVRLERRCEG